MQENELHTPTLFCTRQGCSDKPWEFGNGRCALYGKACGATSERMARIDRFAPKAKEIMDHTTGEVWQVHVRMFDERGEIPAN